MNIDPKDPRLTAFVLGELEDEQERNEIEKALEHSEALRREVEEIQETAALVATELEREPSFGLSPEHQERIEAELPASSPPRTFPLRVKWGMAGGLAAAACVIFAIVISTPELHQTGADPQILAELPSPATDAPASEVSAVERQLDDERAIEAVETADKESLRAEDSPQIAGQTGMDNESFRKRESEKSDGLGTLLVLTDESDPQEPKVASVERDNVMVGGSLGQASEMTGGAAVRP